MHLGIEKALLVSFFAFLCCALPSATVAETGCQAIKGTSGTLYVPVYSYIYAGDQLRPFNLAVTVSLRNTSANSTVTISSATYHDQKGSLIKKIVDAPFKLAPLETYSYKIRESDVAGGSGGSVVVGFNSADPISVPLLETVSIGTAGGQGVSFSSRGQLVDHK